MLTKGLTHSTSPRGAGRAPTWCSLRTQRQASALHLQPGATPVTELFSQRCAVGVVAATAVRHTRPPLLLTTD